MSHHVDKTSLRSQLRQQRRDLSPLQQRQASEALCRQLWRLPAIRRAKHIAFYWPSDGEISPLPLMQRLQRQGKQCYLPVIKRDKQMQFIRMNQAKLIQNRFGIPEPLGRVGFAVKHLDIILMPLVGFDERGGRLGMGGGYYDRALAFKNRQNWRGKPWLVGLAHDLQKVALLPTESWDIDLAAVVTEKEVFEVRRL